MIRALYEPMLELETFRQIRGRMQKNTGVIQVGGCIDSQKAHLIACLAEEYPVTCIIAPDDLRAREIYENYRVFDRDVLLYPARDYIFFHSHVRGYKPNERPTLLQELLWDKDDWPYFKDGRPQKTERRFSVNARTGGSVPVRP